MLLWLGSVVGSEREVEGGGEWMEDGRGDGGGWVEDEWKTMADGGRREDRMVGRIVSMGEIWEEG